MNRVSINKFPVLAPGLGASVTVTVAPFASSGERLPRLRPHNPRFQPRYKGIWGRGRGDNREPDRLRRTSANVARTAAPGPAFKAATFLGIGDPVSSAPVPTRPVFLGKTERVGTGTVGNAFTAHPSGAGSPTSPGRRPRGARPRRRGFRGTGPHGRRHGGTW